MWDSLFWLGRTANSVIYCGLWRNQLPERIHEVQSAGFAVMHLRAVVFSVEREKLAVTKIFPRRFKMYVEFSLLKVIPFRR